MHYLLLLFFTISFNSLVYADYTKACFEDSQTAGNALRSIEFLKTESDKILLVGGCLKIETSTTRINLFQKFLRKKFAVSFMDLSTSVPIQNCHIKIRKVKELKNDSSQIGLNKANASSSRSQTVNTSKLTLAEGLSSSISYNDQIYTLTCYQKANGYEINLKAQSDNLGIQTTRFLKNGEEVELGDILSKSKDQTQSIDSNNGIKVQNSNKTQVEKIYMSVE